MRAVSEKFKETAKAPIKTVEAKVTINPRSEEPTVLTSNDRLVSVSFEQAGELFGTAATNSTIKLLGAEYDLKGREVKIEVYLPTYNDEPEPEPKPKPKPGPIPEPLEASSIEELEYLQDFYRLSYTNWHKVVGGMTEETPYTLKDKRDDKQYKIAKLKDGNVWFCQNLYLGGTKEIVLVPEDSDVTEEFTLPKSTTYGFIGENNNACYVESANGWYSWFTATAGTGTTSLSDGDNAPSSIAPRGWRLPTGGTEMADGNEMKALLNAYAIDGQNAYKALIKTPVPNFQVSGYRYANNKFNSLMSMFWTSIQSFSSVYIMSLSSSSIASYGLTSASYGCYVRPILCAPEEGWLEDEGRDDGGGDDDDRPGPEEVLDHLDFGYFYIDDCTVSEDRQTTIIKLYDKMGVMQNEEYISGILPFPTSVQDLAGSIGKHFELEVAEMGELPNADYEITEDLYAKISNTNYRNILGEIAGVTATMAYVDGVKGEIGFRRPDISTAETLTYNNLLTAKIGEHYGPVNAVVLARTPQEDNIAVMDNESIAESGITEVKLANNEIMDDEREKFAQPILEAVKGLEWTAFECTTEGHGWHEVGDMITIKSNGEDDLELGEGTWLGLITGVTLTINGGFKETLKGVLPPKTTTDYSLAGGITRTIYDTEIKVDKQGQQITSIVSRQDTFEGQTLEQFSRIEQSLSGVVTTIQTTGGGNLIHNSVGYNINPSDKTLANWEEDGTVSSQSSPESRQYGGTSGNQIDLGASSKIVQRIAVDNSGSQLYTLSFKAKKGTTGTAKVSLQNTNDDFNVEIPEGESPLWQSYSLVGLAPSSTYFDLVVETDAEVTSFAITDLMLSVGNSIIPWVPASDEILSTNVAVDSNGVTVRASSTNDYVVLDELGLNGYSDAGGSMRNVFTVNRDTTEVAKMKAREMVYMPPIKIVPVKSGSRAGWCFVKEED